MKGERESEESPLGWTDLSLDINPDSISTKEPSLFSPFCSSEIYEALHRHLDLPKDI